MKKLFLALVLIAVLCAPAVAGDSFRGNLVASTEFNGLVSSVTGSAIPIADFVRVAFWSTLSAAGNATPVTVDVTVDVSFDGTTWIDASFFDFGGGSTLQTTEQILDGASAIGWFDNRGFNARFMRVVGSGSGSTTDTTVNFTSTFSAQK